MRKSMLSLFSLLLVLSMLFTACSGSAPTEEPVDAPTEEAPTSSETVEITIWTMPNGADPQGSIDAEIAEFNKIHPNIKVTAEIVGWGDAYGRIQTAVQGGEGPCLTQMGTTWVPTFGTMGGMKEYEDAEIDELGGMNNFVAASWETAGVSGKTVAIPWFADVRAIAYRKDVFEQAGLDPEAAFKDMDSFIAALEAIKDAGLTTEDGLEIAPFHHPGRNDWNVWQNASMWIWAYGGELLNADGSEAVFNSPEAVAGIKMYNSLYGMGLTPEDTLELNSSQTDSRFGEGTTASYITGPWIISNARDMENSGWTETAA
ncbi:MAG: extracellular solute-binding protein, partial [Anaerolineae bacterium]|nr:extracellular solute-binding protein [Anaerolineae bacterium]